MSVVLAHQGGWDEALLVVVPLVAFVGLLRLANRRARAAEDTRRRQRADEPGLDRDGHHHADERRTS